MRNSRSPTPSPLRNIPLFIAFRVLFNARWYYPVMAVLFLDLGISLVEFALLNVVWAVAIVCLEVPSGALADQIGRRRMIVLAAVLMLAEMLLLAFVPAGSAWLFPALVLNRILSGAAEASASGADESLAYDSLVDAGREAEWPSVLARVQRWQSVAFIVAMLGGSAVYDPAIVRALSGGIFGSIPQDETVRWPVFLTLGNAVAVLILAFQMREPDRLKSNPSVGVGGTIRQIRDAGSWIVQSRFVLLVILVGLCLDSIIRMFLTVNSNYYRLIGLPEVSFGAIAAGLAAVGFFTPRISQHLVAVRSIRFNFAAAATTAFVGLGICAAFWPVWGVIAVVPLGVAFSMAQFFVSHYMNQAITDSSLRATVLSFKGLAFNLGYGFAGLVFAGISFAASRGTDADGVFRIAMQSLPVMLLLALAGIGGLAFRRRA